MPKKQKLNEAGASSVQEVEIKRQIVKGGVPLDDIIPQSTKDTHHVLREGDEVWDAKLNLSNTTMNNNKYYFIQLLEADKDANGKYYVWTRWGRVGHVGACDMDGPFDKETAKHRFESKFKQKTSGHWSDRDSMPSNPNKYRYLKASYDFKDSGEDLGEAASSASAAGPAQPPPECQLHTRLQHLIKLVCNVDEMTKQMAEIGYDHKKLPLGKLAEATIKQGQAVLRRLSDVVAGRQTGSVNSLTDEFYSLIPHNFGFAKMSSFVLRTEEDVRKKMEMLESLTEVSFAVRLLSGLSEGVHPLTASYRKLACEMEPLARDDAFFEQVVRCVGSTAGTTGGHTHYTLEVEDVLEVHREGEAGRFQAGRGGRLGNHRLLWHGSRLTNWVGILSKGLLIAPPEAPVTGYMFGKGVYFADVVTKRTGILVLCEVALGDVNELTNADYNAGGKLGLRHSTQLPMGPLVPSTRSGLSLQYNEYIVYHLDQVRMRYLVRVKFNRK